LYSHGNVKNLKYKDLSCYIVFITKGMLLIILAENSYLASEGAPNLRQQHST
jgi:hypothetical protein